MVITKVKISPLMDNKTRKQVFVLDVKVVGEKGWFNLTKNGKVWIFDSYEQAQAEKSILETTHKIVS